MELELLIAEVLAVQTQTICDRVEARWGNQSSIKGNSEIHAELPLILGPLITEVINAHGMKAWISEFGSGSSLDKTSPYLQNYMASSNFNQWRFFNLAMPIMGRSAGTYVDLDGVEHESSGKMAGLDLERDGREEFQPFTPQHIIREEVERAFPDIADAIRLAVRDYTISQLTMEIQIYI